MDDIFKSEMKCPIQIIANGQWIYIGEMSEDEIRELLKKAENMSENTANDPV